MSGARHVPDKLNAVEVARRLGLSRRRVIELADSVPDFPSSDVGDGGYRSWPSGAVDAWAAAHPDERAAYALPDLSVREPALAVGGPVTEQTDVVLRLAVGAAARLNHPGVDTDHLGLALLDPNGPGAARAVLESFGLTLQAVERVWVEMNGDPHDAPSQEVQASTATKLALDRAKLEALELRDEEITSEHILLDLLRDAHDPQMRVPEFAASLLGKGLVSSQDAMRRLLFSATRRCSPSFSAGAASRARRCETGCSPSPRTPPRPSALHRRSCHRPGEAAGRDPSQSLPARPLATTHGGESPGDQPDSPPRAAGWASPFRAESFASISSTVTATRYSRPMGGRSMSCSTRTGKPYSTRRAEHSRRSWTSRPDPALPSTTGRASRAQEPSFPPHPWTTDNPDPSRCSSGLADRLAVQRVEGALG